MDRPVVVKPVRARCRGISVPGKVGHFLPTRRLALRPFSLGVLPIKTFCLVFAFLMSSFTAGAQAAGPQLPCDASTTAVYPPPGAAPTVAIWQGSDLEKSNWQPPSCTGWPATSRSKLVVTLAGSFHFDGAMDGLLTRIGAISTLKDILYWSATEKKWGRLSYDASALIGPNANDRRQDFSASDLVKGADLYYWEDDTSTGSTVYRLRVSESTPLRAVISSDNVTTVREFVFTLFKPGDLQSILFIQQLSLGTFGAYIITRTGNGASVLASGHEELYVNRAAALYRKLAGVKTDQEPPAAR
jgi:hypothetical protein